MRLGGQTLLVSTAILAVSVVGACFGSSSSGGNGGGTCQASSGTTAGFTEACSQCVQSSCASLLGSFQSGCGDYLACICPGGTEDDTKLQSCEPMLQEAACSGPSQAVGTCIEQSCASACSGGGGSSGGGSSGGGSGGGSSGSSSGAGDSGLSTVDVSCDQSAQDGTCTLVPVPQLEQATLDQNCTGQGGTPGTACPSANLVGCCSLGGATESCYYDNDPSQALEASNCSAAGGTWQTTP